MAFFIKGAHYLFAIGAVCAGVGGSFFFLWMSVLSRAHLGSLGAFIAEASLGACVASLSGAAIGIYLCIPFERKWHWLLHSRATRMALFYLRYIGIALFVFGIALSARGLYHTVDFLGLFDQLRPSLAEQVRGGFFTRLFFSSATHK